MRSSGEDQAAGMPPAAGTTILALGAGEAGPTPAAAPGITGRRQFDGTYPVAICLDNGQHGPTGYLFHGRQFLTVPECVRRDGSYLVVGELQYISPNG